MVERASEDRCRKKLGSKAQGKAPDAQLTFGADGPILILIETSE
jgi:hypothetical protein